MHHRWTQAALLALSCGFIAGCSLTRFMTAGLTSALTDENSTVFTGEEDIDLARDALPFTIKMYETLLQRDSNNVRLLLATGKLVALYAQAFVLFPSDTLEARQPGAAKMQRLRAKRLFLRSREYSFRAIAGAHPEAGTARGVAAVDSLLVSAAAADTALLYLCASSWLGAIAADRSDLALAMSVKRPVALLRKLCELDSGYGAGAAHELLSVCAAVTPTAIGGGAKAARFHFEKACAWSGGGKVSPYVSFATSWCIKTADRDEYITMLRRALDVDSKREPSMRLQNMIVRERAQWYLDNTERFFPPVADTAGGVPATAEAVIVPGAAPVSADSLPVATSQPAPSGTAADTAAVPEKNAATAPAEAGGKK